jgi:hypothetical protein
VAHRREWAVVLDDGYQLPLAHRWLPGPRSWLLGLAAGAALLALAWSLGVQTATSWLVPRLPRS